MTAIQHKTIQKAVAIPSFEDNVPLMIRFAPNWPVRTVLFRILGTALVVSSAAMWALPGADTGPELVLMKLGSSICFLLCGLALLMTNHADNQPDAYFDPIRRELRVLQKNNRGRPETVLRRSYDSLGSARFRERQMELYDVDGSLLMRLPIASTEIRQALRLQLCGMVNITA